YFRRLAAGEADDDDGYQQACTFLGQHGQSLDWVFDGNPGGMICGAAARSPRRAADAELLSVGMIEPTNDPVHAAIEAHREAFKHYEGLLTEQNQLENELPRHRRQSFFSADSADVVQSDDPRWIENQRATLEACQIEDDALCHLMDLVPSSME